DAVAGDMIQVPNVVRSKARAVNSRGAVREVCGARLKLDVDCVCTAAAQRSRCCDGKAVHAIVAEECADVRPRAISCNNCDQVVAVVYLHIDDSVQSVAVGRPAGDCVAAGMIYEPDVVWRPTGAAVDWCWAAGKVSRARLKPDADRVRVAVLERGRRWYTKAM